MPKMPLGAPAPIGGAPAFAGGPPEQNLAQAMVSQAMPPTPVVKPAPTAKQRVPVKHKINKPRTFRAKVGKKPKV
jgi:hypothetical protein